jgi:Golgi SNAP receptor complex protein 1
MSTYDSLHRQCRTLESLFDAKLTSYARLAASISRAGTAADHDLEAGPSWREAESEVEELLEKVRPPLCPRLFSPSTSVEDRPEACDGQLGETNSALDAVAQDTDNPPSQSMLRAIQRHRDVYQDYGKEFRRTKVRPLVPPPKSLVSVLGRLF